MLDNLTLDPVSYSNTSGSGSVDWNYAASNSEIDFMGAGDSATLTFDVKVSDGSGTGTLKC
ncbi:MAG: VCBS domain-containing protein [Fuerstiella sp.]